MKTNVVPVLVLAVLAGCVAREDKRVERIEVALAEAEVRLAAARAVGDPAVIAAAEDLVVKIRVKLERAEEDARKAREARSAFWMGVIGLGLAGAKALGGLAGKGAMI